MVSNAHVTSKVRSALAKVDEVTSATLRGVFAQPQAVVYA